MEQHGEGVTFMGDSAQYELKHMLPECFVSVKLEAHEESSCSDLQQYPVAQSSTTTEISSQPSLTNREACCSRPSSTCNCASSKQLCLSNLSTSPSPSQIHYQVHMTSPMMQQTQRGSQSQPAQPQQQATTQAHASEASLVPQGGGVNRAPPQPTAPPPALPSHSFSHPHSRTSDIAWMSHSYVDQGTQHFHAHQMAYLPNDGTLLTIPHAQGQSQEGARIVKQSSECSPSVSCRSENNPATTAVEAGDNNAFISYVLNPQRGVPATGIFLFDASRGVPTQTTHQLQVNRGDGSRNDEVHTVPGRSVEEAIRDNSSDTTSTAESPKPGENHLVSRSCQTVVTMSQIQDAPLTSDAKIIITEAPSSDIVTEPEDSKDRVFIDADGKSYPSQQALVNHDRYHRGERPYECETCHKAFATNSHLVTHRRTHTGERPFQCQLCQRCFGDRSAFVKHERTHGPNGAIIKRYKCDECGSVFVDSCGLKKHIRIHTGERPYVCDVCEKSFSASSTFVAHKRIHTGERPYKCDSCDKMFITKSHLLTHRRTHTGEKPFTCNVCNRCFADGSSFRRHERLHSGENRHICMHCGRGFPLESSLQKHKQTHVQTSTFSYMYENRNDLNCVTPQQPSCDLQTNRSSRVSIPQVRDTSERNICVDLSREITGEVPVNRNSMCSVASREMDCDNPTTHTSIMVTAREIA